MRLPIGRRPLALLLSLGLVTAACGSDSSGDAAGSDSTDAGSTTVPENSDGETTETVEADGSEGAGEGSTLPIDDAQCEENRAFGTITYLSGFDFAAAAGIVDVMTADEMGYFEALCLDVELIPSSAPTNLSLVAAGEAEFANAGSFGDLVTINVNGETDLVAVLQYGKVGIQALAVPDDAGVESLADLAGKTIGIKGDLPPDIEAMLGLSGVPREDVDEVLLDTFDPFAAFELGVDALPVYKSNEVVQLDAGEFAYTLYDPAEMDVPASFGILATSPELIADHPGVVQSFVSAALAGHAHATANPDEAVDLAIERINGSGNAFFLFDETERPRWTIESQIVPEATPDGEGPGIPDTDRLGEEAELLTTIGRFDATPDWESMVDDQFARSAYDGETLLWAG